MGTRKTPYLIHLRSRRPFSFAGIWSWRRADERTQTATCAMLTCAPEEMEAYEVSTLVNSPRNDLPERVRRVDG